jgi:hypothetical protein
LKKFRAKEASDRMKKKTVKVNYLKKKKENAAR